MISLRYSPSRRAAITIARSVLLAIIANGAVAQAYADCGCGPDYCKNDSRYNNALNAKKKSMKAAGYPDDLIALLGKDGACYARVEQSPDIFTIRLISSNGYRDVPWTKQDEDLARKELQKGEISAYYKFNVAAAFKCCDDQAASERPDWNSTDDLNTGLAIKCEKSGDSVTCH